MSARTASQFFAQAPDRVLRLLPQSTRLDMLDYFNYGSSKASKNYFEGEARVRSLSDTTVVFDMDNSVNMAMTVIPMKKDTIIALVTTLELPVPDSSIKFYDTDWNQLGRAPLAWPGYDEWLTPEGKKNAAEVRMFLPFVPVKAAFSGDASRLTLSNGASSYLSAEDFERLRPWLREEIVYDINNGKFVRRKP